MSNLARNADPFVGREPELTELTAGLSRALRGQGRLFLVSGDPGIGKTRLVDEIGALAEQQSARVLWGRCWQGGGAPAFWIWVQVLRGLMPELPVADLERRGVDVDELRRLILEPSGGTSPGADGAADGDPEQARFRLFEAVASCLRLCAERQPLVLILDDLHWATASSLLLLRYVARSLRDARILILGTYRDADVRLRPELAPVVAELVREGQRISLTGLGREQVAQFVSMLAGNWTTDKLVASIYRVTEGNPFFVDEVVRLLLAEVHARSQPHSVLPDTRLPDEVREVIRRRIEPLEPRLREILSYAAVIGREFDAPLLEEITAHALSAGNVVDFIGEAVRSGVVVEAGNHAGRFLFAHGLIRDVLYDEIPTAQRSELHLRVGQVLSEPGIGRGRSRLAEVAHHLCLAAPAGDVPQAIDYAERAGREALSLLAYEEAAGCFANALRAMELGLRASPGLGIPVERRIEILISLGDARWRYGDIPRSIEAYAEAIELARRAGHPRLFARAALGMGKVKIERAAIDPQFVGILEEALHLLPDAPSTLRAHLLARLTTALQYGNEPDAQRRCAQQAVEMARQLDDRATLAAALSAQRTVLWEPAQIGERAKISMEMIELARASGDAELELLGRQMHVADQLELGDIPLVDREIAAFAELARSRRLVRFTRYAMVFRAARALLDGRLADAEALVEEALRSRESEAHPSSYYLTQLVLLRHEQGRMGETQRGLEEFARRSPEQRTFRCGLALAHAEAENHDGARSLLDSLGRFGFVDFPHDGFRLLCFALLARVCTLLDDAIRAAPLYESLLPAATHNVVVVGGIAFWGNVEHHLGTLAAVLGRRDEALVHLSNAIAEHSRLGARCWLARTHYERGRLLRHTDPVRAREDLIAARDAATSLDMRRLLAQVEAELAADQPSEAPTTARDLVGALGAEGEFRRLGDVWNIGIGDALASVEDSKGLRYLAHLMQHPGVELHATELVGLSKTTGDDSDAKTLRKLASSDAGEVLDARAAAEYKRRLRELQEDLAEAEARNDLGRSEQLQVEIEFLTQELKGALGLGGRRRKAGSQAERARVNVTKVIRAALDRVRTASPDVGRHLDRTIRTGTFCSYSPEADRKIAWRF